MTRTFIKMQKLLNIKYTTLSLFVLIDKYKFIKSKLIILLKKKYLNNS